MNRLQNNLLVFTELLGETFKVVNLNKSQPSQYSKLTSEGWAVDDMGSMTPDKIPYYTETFIHKGVEADFIKLYQGKHITQQKHSIGFSFQYIDVPQENQTVQYSVKIQPRKQESFDFYQSEKMSLSDFKIKLNIVNQQLQALSSEDRRTQAVSILNQVFSASLQAAPKAQNQAYNTSVKVKAYKR